MTYLNLAYRFNGGTAYTGNIYFDWYFYDPRGTTHSYATFAFWMTRRSLCYTSNTTYMPTGSDYKWSARSGPVISNDTNYAQKLSLGCSTSNGSATYYQARIKAGSKIAGAATAYTPAASTSGLAPQAGITSPTSAEPLAGTIVGSWLVLPAAAATRWRSTSTTLARLSWLEPRPWPLQRDELKSRGEYRLRDLLGRHRR